MSLTTNPFNMKFADSASSAKNLSGINFVAFIFQDVYHRSPDVIMLT